MLVGTQMIAKGLDLPLVTLVGVVAADVGLYLPDFRSGERTFQLLTQVAGRAGRSARGGRVIIQTYQPEHYAIQAAAQHDYDAFYEREMTFRREHGYPPMRRLARLVYWDKKLEKVQIPCAEMAAVLSTGSEQSACPARWSTSSAPPPPSSPATAATTAGKSSCAPRTPRRCCGGSDPLWVAGGCGSDVVVVMDAIADQSAE